MDKFVDFQREKIPAWYELSITSPSTLLVSVHESAREWIETTPWQEAPIVKCWQKELQLGDFALPQAGAWGFSKALRPVSISKNQWTAWEFSLPCLKAAPDKKESTAGYALALRSTLSVLFNVLWLFRSETKWPQPQLMIIEGINIGRELGSASLGATLTPAMCQWLATQENDSFLQSIIDAMIAADNEMYWIKREGDCQRFHHYDFRAIFNKSKWLHLNVPGNACGLDPQDYADPSPEVGYQLCPHNVDNSIQQLTLLTGLARLCELAQTK